MPSKKRQIIEQAKFAYSPFGKACEKQTKTIAEQGKKERKTIEEQGKKQVEALEVLKPEKDKEEIKQVGELFPKGLRNNKIKTEVDETKKWGKNLEEKIQYIQQININVIFYNMQQ